MKNLLLIILTLFLNSCILGEDEELGGLSTDDSIVAFYKFDGNAKDSSGNGHNGTIMGTTLYSSDRFNNTGKACEFDGTTTYIEIAPDKGFNFTDSEFTISVWIYRVVAAGGTIFNHFPAGNPEIDIHFATDNPNFQINSGAYSTSSTFALSLDIWYHLVFTWDKNRLKLYIDGEFNNEFSGAVFNNYTGNYQANIGASHSANNWFRGRMDDFIIFKRALSDDEVEKLYENTR